MIASKNGAWAYFILNIKGSLCSGATTANIIALAAARDAVLGTQGWDVDTHGLVGAPNISIFVGAEAHSSVHKALGVVGLGRGGGGGAGCKVTNNFLTRLPADAVGAVQASALAGLTPPTAPAIVVLQAGHVNTGAFDDFNAVIAWVGCVFFFIKKVYYTPEYIYSMEYIYIMLVYIRTVHIRIYNISKNRYNRQPLTPSNLQPSSI